MNFKDYQEEVLKMPLYDDVIKGLIGELGEVMELLKKNERQGNRRQVMTKDRFNEEMGDVLWYFSRLASQYGASLNEIAKENVKKLRERHGLNKE
jgi:NTP pyrophosphatase (non-canonical NTP hydrolase)